MDTIMQSKIRGLLDKLCVEQGFCLAANKIEKIVTKEDLDAKEFAKLVLFAEGMNPEIEIEHFRAIRRAFRDLFGDSIAEQEL